MNIRLEYENNRKANSMVIRALCIVHLDNSSFYDENRETIPVDEREVDSLSILGIGLPADPGMLKFRGSETVYTDRYCSIGNKFGTLKIEVKKNEDGSEHCTFSVLTLDGKNSWEACSAPPRIKNMLQCHVDHLRKYLNYDLNPENIPNLDPGVSIVSSFKKRRHNRGHNRRDDIRDVELVSVSDAFPEPSEKETPATS